MEGGTAADYRGIKGWVDKPNNTLIRNNGNNVDIDMEMVSMRETASMYETLTQIYSKRADGIKSAIRGRSR